MAYLKWIAVFGMCSVSFFSPAEASSYSSFSTENNYQLASTQTIKMTRSARETSNSANIPSSRGPHGADRL